MLELELGDEVDLGRRRVLKYLLATGLVFCIIFFFEKLKTIFLAEEGRDYFNEVGVITFGPNDTYKTAKVRLSKKRGLVERTFRLELGNDEGNQDMNRKYETEIKIKPIKWAITTDDIDTDDDTDDFPVRNTYIFYINFIYITIYLAFR